MCIRDRCRSGPHTPIAYAPLPAAYAMRGTTVAYAATLSAYAIPPCSRSSCCYATRGTEVAYGATRCAVLRYSMVVAGGGFNGEETAQ
eukprot:2367450-Rhodomonas_salina.1